MANLFFLTSLMNIQCHFSAVVNMEQRSAIKVKWFSSTILSSGLPDGEKAASLAILEKSVFALSLSGRVFESNVESSSSVLRFSPVSELSGKENVCLSGIVQNCLAVSSDGRVFGRGFKHLWPTRPRQRNTLCIVFHRDFVTFQS